jgi:DNA mismatch endonuclease (patch repair protein)
MTEVLTPSQRRHCMSRIRRDNTEPEIILRSALWRAGLRYRRKSKLPGRPDIIFPGGKMAVFVDGCFWHLCPKHFTMPKTNRAFWKKKLERNRERDSEVNFALRKLGWRVIRIWEHQLRSNPQRCTERILLLLQHRS